MGDKAGAPHWPPFHSCESGHSPLANAGQATERLRDLQKLMGLDGPDAQARRYCLEILEGWNGGDG